jgi:hypothetical protein
VAAKKGDRPSDGLFADLFNQKFRWPARGDRLFVAASDPATEAEIHDWTSSRSGFMTDGYKTAADKLVEEALGDRIVRHELIYPIIFCYRQFIELSLKRQILSYGRAVGVGLPRRKDHDLKALLKTFRIMCKEYDSGEDEAIIVVSKCILEFARMDPDSFTFRYATDRLGNLYPVSTDRIDLEKLKDVMDGIGAFFSGSDAYLFHLTDAGPQI